MPSNGDWVSADDDRWFETTNPCNKEVDGLVARGNRKNVDAAVTSAYNAFRHPAWAEMKASKRGSLLWPLGDLVAANAERLAAIEMRENGKPMAENRAQIRCLAEGFHYCGGLADKVEGKVIPSDKDGVFNFTRYEPLGAFAIITPWN